MSKSNELVTSSSGSGGDAGGGSLKDDPQAIKSTTWLQLLSRILLVLLVLFLIFCAIGYCMPRNYSVESSTIIDAPPEAIFPLLVNLDRWKEWSPGWDFAANKQIASFHFTEDRKGVTWRHEARGVTNIWVSDSTLNKEITMGLEDSALSELNMVTRIELSVTDDNKTEIRWSSETELPSKPLASGIFYGWGGLMYTGGLQTQYERDLVRLKTVCETKE